MSSARQMEKQLGADAEWAGVDQVRRTRRVRSNTAAAALTLRQACRAAARARTVRQVGRSVSAASAPTLTESSRVHRLWRELLLRAPRSVALSASPAAPSCARTFLPSRSGGSRGQGRLDLSLPPKSRGSGADWAVGWWWAVVGCAVVSLQTAPCKLGSRR